MEDKETNNVSLINVVEQLVVGGLPPHGSDEQEIPLDIELRIVSLWARTDWSVPEQTEGRMLLYTPHDRQITIVTSFPIDLQGFKRTRTIGVWRRFSYFGAGIYEHVIEVKTAEGWSEVARLPLDVMLEGQSSQE